MNDMFNRVLKKFKEDKYYLEKIIRTSLTRGLAAIGTFLFNFVLAKYLGVTDFGHFMLAYTILVVLGIIVRFGMPPAIIRFAGIMVSGFKVGQLKKLKRDTYYLCFLFGIVATIIMSLSQEVLINKFFDKAPITNFIIVISIAIPFYSILTIQSAFLKALKKPEIAPLFEAGLTTFVTAIVVQVIALSRIELTLFFVGNIFLFSAIFVFIAGKLIVDKFISDLEGNRDYKLENYNGFYVTLFDYAIANLVRYAVTFSPIIILGYFATGEDIGLFSIANSISFVIAFILWIVNSVYAPFFASLYKLNQLQELRKLVRRSIYYMLAISLPCFMLIVLFPETILKFFGEEFIQAKKALYILCTAQLINVSVGPIYFLLDMTGYERKVRNIVITAGVISLILSMLLIPKFGFEGAAIASGVGLVLQNLLALFYKNKIFNN